MAAVESLAAVLGISEPDFTLQRALGELAPGEDVPALPLVLWIVVPLQALIFAVVFAPVGWGEEFGWRGYLQVRLFVGRPLSAAVVTGLIWGAWHYPLILAGYQFPDDRVLGLLVFPVSCVLLSIVFGWLQQRAGSVWAPSLAHSAANVVGGSLLLLLFAGGPNWILVHYLGILGWIPLGALCTWIILTGRLRPGRQPVESRRRPTGVFLGAPYDWRKPTRSRLLERNWNREDRRLLTPKDHGWGWTVNLYEALRRLWPGRRP